MGLLVRPFKMNGRTSPGMNGRTFAPGCGAGDVGPLRYDRGMKPKQQELPLRQWGGARRGAGRKRASARRNVPHRRRRRFRHGALHVTVRLRPEVWNLRSHRCFRALRRSFAAGCARFGFRLVHFSVQGNHVHMIVEAPDAASLGRAMKGLEVRMARALNKVMRRRGPVFADRYHAELLRSPRQAANAIRYVLENSRLHAVRSRRPVLPGIDPYCSLAWLERAPPVVADARCWLLRVAAARAAEWLRAARCEPSRLAG
ncbi:MAG TPA: transposase [Myxococcales bacterium]